MLNGDKIDREIRTMKVVLEVLLENFRTTQSGGYKNFTILAQEVTIKRQSLNMVVMEVRERNDDRASFSNFHILEAASSINDDLDIRRADLEACCVTAKSREVSTGYGNRSSHAMECHPDHAFTPSSMQEVTAFKNKTDR